MRRLTAHVPEAGLSREELIGEVPEMLPVLAECVAPGAIMDLPEKLPATLETLAAAHAEQRFNQNVQADFLYRENDVLRESVLAAIGTSAVEIPKERLYLLSRLLDLIALACTRHRGALRDAAGGAGQRSAAGAQPSVERDLEVISRAEAALRKSEERYLLMVESVRDYGVFIISVEGGSLDGTAGPRTSRVTRQRSSSALLSPPSSPPRRSKSRSLNGCSGAPPWGGNAQFEGWLVRKDGTRLWSVLTIDSVKDDEGKLLGFSNVARGGRISVRSIPNQGTRFVVDLRSSPASSGGRAAGRVGALALNACGSDRRRFGRSAVHEWVGHPIWQPPWITR